LRASLVAQTGADDASYLAVAPMAETASPIAVAEAVVEDLPPAVAPTPLQAADAVVEAAVEVPAETPAEADSDIVNPEANAAGE
jgi:hypothetical protein